MAEKKTILVVDDEPDIVNLTQKFLELENYDTITCNNGKEALKIVEEKYPDIVLILLDVMMPGGADGYITKPFSGNDLLKYVKKLLKEKGIL